jgi:hypothetical protein
MAGSTLTLRVAEDVAGAFKAHEQASGGVSR